MVGDPNYGYRKDIRIGDLPLNGRRQPFKTGPRSKRGGTIAWISLPSPKRHCRELASGAADGKRLPRPWSWRRTLSKPAHLLAQLLVVTRPRPTRGAGTA